MRVLLEHHDTAGRRSPASRERSQDLASIQRKLGKGCSSGQERGAIPWSLGHQKNQKITLAVSPLDCEPPMERLSVADDGFSLDHRRPSWAGNHRIPSAAISQVRKWHLGPPHEVSPKAPAEPFEEPVVSSITNGIAGRIGAQRGLEPNDLGEAKQILEGRTLDLSALQPAYTGGIQATRVGDRLLTEAGSLTSTSDVVHKPDQRAAGRTSRSVDRSFMSGHLLELGGQPFAGTYQAARPGLAQAVHVAPGSSKRTTRKRSSGDCPCVLRTDHHLNLGSVDVPGVWCTKAEDRAPVRAFPAREPAT